MSVPQSVDDRAIRKTAAPPRQLAESTRCARPRRSLRRRPACFIVAISQGAPVNDQRRQDRLRAYG